MRSAVKTFCVAAFLLLPATVPDALAQLQAVGVPVAVTEGGSHIAPQWSPDGSRIAFTGAGYAGIFVLDVEGGSVDTVTTEAAAGFGFRWSPDGASLLARPAQFEGPRRLDAVKIYDVDTHEEDVIVDYGADLSSLPQWSSSGSEVLLYSGTRLESIPIGDPQAQKSERSRTEWFTTHSGLARLDPGRDEPTIVPEVSDGPILNLVESPDGSRIAFEVLGGHLFSMDTDGSNRIDLGVGHRPSWSPDGEWIVFMITEDDGHTYTSSDLYAIRADGSERSRLTHTAGRLEMNPSWSPDGSQIAFDDLTDGTLYVLNVAR